MDKIQTSIFYRSYTVVNHVIRKVGGSNTNNSNSIGLSNDKNMVEEPTTSLKKQQ